MFLARAVKSIGILGLKRLKGFTEFVEFRVYRVRVCEADMGFMVWGFGFRSLAW